MGETTERPPVKRIESEQAGSKGRRAATVSRRGERILGICEGKNSRLGASSGSQDTTGVVFGPHPR